MSTQPSEKIIIQAVLRYLSLRVRSKHELSEYIASKTSDAETQKAVMIYLEDHQLYDDASFTKTWIENRLHHGKGDRLITMELRQKGVDPEIVRQQLADIPREMWMAAIQSLLTKQQTKWAHLSGYAQKMKRYQICASHGFSSFHIDAFLANRVE